MIRVIALAVGFVLAGSTASWGQTQPVPRERSGPCQPELTSPAMCGNVQHGEGRLLACLRHNAANVSPQCRAMMIKKGLIDR
jgi:hypothetical protein